LNIFGHKNENLCGIISYLNIVIPSGFKMANNNISTVDIEHVEYAKVDKVDKDAQSGNQNNNVLII